MENLIYIVKAAQTNDYSAVETLFSGYSKPVYSVALKLSGSTDYAVNITQEVFIEVFQTIGGLSQPNLFPEELKRVTFAKCAKYFPGIADSEQTKVDFTEEINRTFDTDKTLESIEIPAIIIENVLSGLKQNAFSETPPVFKANTPPVEAVQAVANVQAAETAKEIPQSVKKPKNKVVIALIVAIILLAGVAVAVIFLAEDDFKIPILGEAPEDNSNRGSGSGDSGDSDDFYVPEDNYIEDDYIENENFNFELEGFNREIVYEGDVFVIDTERIPHIHLGGANITNELLDEYIKNGIIPFTTTDLSIESNLISDISPLKILTGMDWLSIQNNQISDISTISEFGNLRVLWAHNNNISDITPLLGLSNLNEVRLCGNPLSQSQITELRNALPNCNVRFDA